MRTQEEIAGKLRVHNKNFLDFTTEMLLSFLDYDHAKEFLKPETTREKWDKLLEPITDERALKELREYAVFAWDKAQDHRGLSAGRSVQKLEAWTWLLGLDEVVKASEAAEYAQYGCPKLKVICEAFGFPIPDDEPTQRMMRGEPCQPDCRNGCGTEKEDDDHGSISER